MKTSCTESKFLNILLISLDNHRFKSIAKVSLMSYNIPEEVKEAIIFSNVIKKAKIFISSEYLPMEENRNLISISLWQRSHVYNLEVLQSRVQSIVMHSRCIDSLRQTANSRLWVIIRCPSVHN